MTYAGSLSGTFIALAEPTRRDILEHLRDTPQTVGALAQKMPISRPAVSQHLKVLSDAGLVTATAQGTRRIYALRPEPLNTLRAYLDGLWSDALTAFEAAALAEAQKDQSK
ncbi:MAG: metalloregulator ArsR/SmtB family transcription factor [Marinovum sp.]|nr:metalloregulator ArsR/SmtB family transcription factor [Marinovum sp.]